MAAVKSLVREKLAGAAPPPGLHLSIVVQTFTYSLGTGFYTAGSIIFFTIYVGLPSKQVALGMSIAALLAFAARIPIGMLSDRLGGRATWRLSALLQALLFSSYPLIDNFEYYVVVVSAIGLAEVAGAIGRDRYIGEVISADSRIAVNSYLRSVLNIGLALGTVSAGALTQVRSHRLLACIVLVYALTFYLDVVLLSFWVKPAPRKPGTWHAPPKGRHAVTDRPFTALSIFRGVFTLSDILFVTVVPLWILQSAHGQKAVIPAMLLLNMLMVTFLQVRAGRGVNGIADSAQRQRRAGILLAVACAIIPIAAHTGGAWTWLVLLAAAAFMTQAELYTAVSGWGLAYGLSPEARRGEYLAVFYSGPQLAGIVGPAAITALVMTTSAGWYVMAAVFLISGLASVRFVDAVVRSRSEDGQGAGPAREAGCTHAVHGSAGRDGSLSTNPHA
jgi:MFS family permease